MKKLRIAFCLRDMQMGGVESVLIRTFDELLKNKNIEISLITYVDITTPVYREYFKKHKKIKLYSLYPSKWLGTNLPHFFLWRLVVHFIRDIYRNVKRPFVMRKFKNIDMFIDYHDFGFHSELRYTKNSKKIAWFHSSPWVFINRNFIKYIDGYDKLVLLTDDCANILRTKYSKYSDKMVRIYNLVNLNQIREKSKEKTNKIIGNYFCIVSRLTQDKDIETVLYAFDLFWKKNKKPDVKMVFVGDGNCAKHHQSIAKSLMAKDQFVFTGAMSNPFIVMKGAVANILSSYGEGLPTVLTEAMSVGTINIASDCKCGPREILMDGQAGLLFEPGNIEELAKCMDDVYNKRVDIKQMQMIANKSLKRFDADEIIKDIISLIS